MSSGPGKGRMGRRELFHRTAIAFLLVVGGCAHAPRLETASSGQLPSDGTASFGFASFDAGEDAALRSHIANCLGRKGMTAADKPGFLVQIAVSNTPRGTGILAGADATAPAAPRPARRSRRQSLVVTLSEIGSGRETYRVQVMQPYSRTAARQPISVLADEACAVINGSRIPTQ